MPVYHVFYVSYMECYVVIKQDNSVLAYIDDLSELTERGYKYIYEGEIK